MLNRLTAFVLIAALITVNCSRFFVYAGFQLNKNYIAARLCENRNKPWLHCNGKCYLMKKLRQAAEKQDAGERESQKSHFQEAYYSKNTSIKIYTHLLNVLVIQSDLIVLPKGHISIFRPPQLA